MKLAIDFFTGSGSFETVARSMGYEVISIDNRRRAGTCEPTLKIDVRDLYPLAFSELNVKAMWFGLPCTIWSFASGGFHLDKDLQPKTELAVSHLEILKSVQDIIENNPDTYWFIENPRGKLQKYPPFLKWLALNKGEINYCTLSSYGFPTTKPTMIATNYPGLKLLPMDAYGRGAKNKAPGTFDNMTKVQRQSTPKRLIKSILNQIE